MRGIYVEGKHLYLRNITLLVALLFICMAAVQPAVAQEVLSDKKKKSVEGSESEVHTATKPEKSTLGSTNKWVLYGGAAALGIGIAAIAGGGGGSSAPACQEEPVGPSIAGNDWTGRLMLQGHGAEGVQEVTASITQCGSAVVINTNSQLSYGRTFDGTISSGGSMFMVEHVRRQDWTTHFSKATSTSIELYDYVNDFNDFDSLVLRR